MKKLPNKVIAALAACSVATPVFATSELKLVSNADVTQSVLTLTISEDQTVDFSSIVIPDFGCVDSMCLPPDWMLGHGTVNLGNPPIEWLFTPSALG